MYKYDQYRTIVHPLIAVVVPASFLISFVLLSTELIRATSDSSSIFMFGLFLVLLILSLFSGISAVVLGNIFQTERFSWAARVRECLAMGFLIYFVASLLRSGTIGSRFSPAFTNVLPVLYAFCQWYCSVLIQKALRDREILVRDLEGLEGTALYTAVREMGLQVDIALKSLTKLKIFVTVSMVILIILLAAQGKESLPLSVPTITSVVLFFALLPFIFALCGQYRFEQFTAGAGLCEQDSQRTARLRTVVILIILTGALALFLQEPLKHLSVEWLLRYLGNLGNWIKQLLPDIHFSLEYEAPPEAPYGEYQDLFPQQAVTVQEVPVIFKFLKIVLPIILSILFLYFLLAPLLSKQYQGVFSRSSIKEFLRSFWLQLRAWVKKQGAVKEQGVQLDQKTIRSVRKRVQGLGSVQQNRMRRRELGRISRSFIRLIRWGKQHDIVFTETSAPRTYVQKLSERFPEYEQRLLDIADCFEQAVYSPYPLGNDRLHQYESAIKSIVQKR